MKATTIYQTEKKAFMFAADCEQRGLNATLKAINAAIATPEACRTLAADGLKKDVFKAAANYVDYLRANLPMIFNNDDALCVVKVVEDNESNRETFAGYQVEEIKVNEALCIRAWIPKVKFTCTEVYNLAKKAAAGAKKAEKAAERAAKMAANEKAKAAKIERLQKQLAELQK